MAQPNIEYKNWTTNKVILKSAMALNAFNPHISSWRLETSSVNNSFHIIGNRTGGVIELSVRNCCILLGVTYICIVFSVYFFC